MFVLIKVTSAVGGQGGRTPIRGQIMEDFPGEVRSEGTLQGSGMRKRREEDRTEAPSESGRGESRDLDLIP